MQSILKVPIMLVMLALLPAIAWPEDLELRNRAVQILDRAQLASRLQGPLNITTEITFTASINGGTAQTGTYRRTRSSNGDLRQDISFQGFHSSMIDSEAGVASVGPWYDLPFAVRKLKDFVPYSPLRFDSTDVIESITETSSGGQPATCIAFVTVRGEDRNPGEICVSRANATVLEWHDSKRSWSASSYASVANALVPSAFTYREGNSLHLRAEVRFTLLDAQPREEMVIPEGWRAAQTCSTYQPPTPVSAPQPAARSPQSPVVHIPIHAHVTAEGKIEAAEVLKPNDAELDAEAVKLVSTWLYRPAVCNGAPTSTVVDVMVNFQGR